MYREYMSGFPRVPQGLVDIEDGVVWVVALPSLKVAQPKLMCSKIRLSQEKLALSSVFITSCTFIYCVGLKYCGG